MSYHLSRRWLRRMPVLRLVGRPRRQLRPIAALGFALAVGLMLGSCGVERGGPAAKPSGHVTSAGNNMPGTPGSTQQYPDRDPDRVAEGLAKLSTPENPCALLSGAVLDARVFPARQSGEPTPSMVPGDEVQPACVAITNDAWSTISITVGGEFSEGEHYDMAPLDLGGFTGYFGDVTISPELEWVCLVEIPVSFTKGVSIQVDRDRTHHQFDPCVVVKALAAHAIETIEKLAGPELLFRFSERDENVEGACVHWLSGGTHEGCVPYRRTSVPDDPQQMVTAAENNSNVACAAALDIVRDVLGEKMQPVTYGDSCVFVESMHEIMFSVSMTDAFATTARFGVELHRPTHLSNREPPA